MLIVVAVAMLRAAMLMLAAVLMLIAMSHLQDPDKPPSPPTPDPRAQRVLERKQAGNDRDVYRDARQSKGQMPEKVQVC